MAITFGEFRISPETYEFWRANESVHLEPRVLEVLAYLVVHRERVIPKEELLEHLWPNQAVSDSALTRAVREARRALGDTGAKNRWIKTVYGRGFRFTGTTSDDPAPEEPPTTVAVSPFGVLGTETDMEVLAAGFTEDIIAALSRIDTLRVVTRVADPNNSPDKRRRELQQSRGASAIVRGNLRSLGERQRVVVELADAASGEILWADSYDRRRSELFAVLAEVVVQIASVLRRDLTPETRRRIDQPPTRDPRAHQLYLQGRYTFARYTVEAARQGIRYFEQAIALDPTFALAHAGLARVWAEIAYEGVDPTGPRVSFAHAKEKAAKALDLDDELGEAYGILGLLAFSCDFDWQRAEREFQRALSLSPGCADVYDHYGWMCQSLDRFDEAHRLFQRALELDPIAHPSDMAAVFLRIGRFAEALEAADRIIEFDPRIARGHAIRGWALFNTGQQDEGIAAIARAAAITEGGTMFLAQLGAAHALTGRHDEATRILARLKAMSEERFVSPYHLAYLYTALGQVDEAMDCLEQACELRASGITGIRCSFLFTSLHSHPRFVALLRKMNLA